ncbi:MAG: hypothetical protein AAFX06_27805 [Planctomycetota bacterium]
MNQLRFLTLTAALLACGCGKTPWSGTDSETAPATDVVTEGEVVQTSAASTGEDFRKRIGQVFENVIPTLDETRGLLDEHGDLPENSIIPFKRDQTSNTAKINTLLDEAIEALGVSSVSDFRQQIYDANAAIAESQETIASYRQKRVSASAAKDQSRLDQVNPFELSKEAIDDKIAEEKAKIEGHRESLVALKRTFAEELSKIGVEVDEAGVESLLSSVSGDDIVTMAVVFDNIKHVTTQLQELTEESGEALETSKRYYGMYVVMVHVMDRIQKTFVEDIRERHIPKLREFSAQADENIEQARKLIKSGGGDAEVLKQNVASNKLTQETAQLYIEYLERNAEVVAAENERAQSNIATAMNTYETVKLSSDVAALMKSGRRDFETMMRLRVPSLREFGNDAIRKEFNRMTTELRSGT